MLAAATVRQVIIPSWKRRKTVLFSTRLRNCLGLLAIVFALSGPMFKGPVRTVSVTAFAESDSTQKSTEGIPLPAPGKSVVSELSGGKSHGYTIALNTSQYFRAVVERRDIDLRLTFYDPSGRALLQLDCRQYDSAVVSLIAEASGLIISKFSHWQRNSLMVITN